MFYLVYDIRVFEQFLFIDGFKDLLFCFVYFTVRESVFIERL